MSHVASATIVVLVTLFGAAAGAEATTPTLDPLPPSECTGLPRPHMRLRLGAPEGMVFDQSTIIDVVNRLWGREGLELDWVPPNAPPTWDGLDAWIQLRRHRIAGAERASGSVAFQGGQTRRFIQVSIDATFARVEWSLASRLQLQPTSVFHLLFAGGRQIVERSLGYTIAHEIGHYVLAQPRHSRDGLMRAAYDPVTTASVRPESMQLDTKSRARLRERLTMSTRCDESRGATTSRTLPNN